MCHLYQMGYIKYQINSNNKYKFPIEIVFEKCFYT